MALANAYLPKKDYKSGALDVSIYQLQRRKLEGLNPPAFFLLLTVPAMPGLVAHGFLQNLVIPDILHPGITRSVAYTCLAGVVPYPGKP